MLSGLDEVILCMPCFGNVAKRFESYLTPLKISIVTTQKIILLPWFSSIKIIYLSIPRSHG